MGGGEDFLVFLLYVAAAGHASDGQGGVPIVYSQSLSLCFLCLFCLMLTPFHFHLCSKLFLQKLYANFKYVPAHQRPATLTTLQKLFLKNHIAQWI